MTGRFVLDASATFRWLFDEDAGRASLDLIIDHRPAVVPALWCLEVVNTLLVHERRGRRTPAESAELLNLLSVVQPEIVRDPQERSLTELATFARPHQLSAYDAVYLDLAVRRGLPLLTFDKNLIAAAPRVGVKLVEVGA